MKPFISVVIPAHNEEAYIGDCLNALAEQSYPKELYEVIVVDNNSTDRTPLIARKAAGDVQVLTKLEGPVGAVRNFGASKAKGDVLAFIDGDCVVDEHWLERAAQLWEKKPHSVFGGGCLLRNNANWVEKNWLLGDGARRVPKHLIGASVLAPKSAFQAVSGFDETLTSGEDTKLSLDLEERGIGVVMTEKLSVVHLGNARTLGAFFKRQVWHSESYFKTPIQAVKDPTFVLVMLNLVLVLLFIATWTFFLGCVRQASLMGIILIPIIFSAKRIIRSGTYRLSPLQFLLIYTLDFTYVFARSCGLLKGVAGRKKKN